MLNLGGARGASLTAEGAVPSAAGTAIAELRRRSVAFAEQLAVVKQDVEPPAWGWYPYRMLPNLIDCLDQLLTGENRRHLPSRPGRFGRAQGSDVGAEPVAYLYDAFEVNDNDPSNYWAFSAAGLRRTLMRSGWSVLDFTVVGNQESEPNSPHEGRAFALLQSELFDRPDMDPMQLDEARLGRLEAADAYLRGVRQTTGG